MYFGLWFQRFQSLVPLFWVCHEALRECPSDLLPYARPYLLKVPPLPNRGQDAN
jgi:hypothetical protein